VELIRHNWSIPRIVRAQTRICKTKEEAYVKGLRQGLYELEQVTYFPAEQRSVRGLKDMKWRFKDEPNP